MGSDVKSSNVMTVSLPSNCLVIQSVTFLGIPLSLMSCTKHGITALGKAPLTSKKSPTTSCFFLQALLMKLVRRWSESVVVHPALPPNCVTGRICSLSIWYSRVSLTHDDRILLMVLSKAIGL